jgi:anti-sigma-K factor RskA
MKHLQLTAELQERAILYAAGALDENERREFAKHLDEDNCEVCRSEVLDSEAAAQSLLMSLPVQTPSESVKKRLLAQAEVSAATQPPHRKERKSPFFALAGWLAAAASVVLLISTYNSNTSLRDQVDALNSRVAQLESEVGGQELKLASLISSRPFTLKGQGNARVQIFWDEPARLWRVYVSGLQQAASNRSYQLWFLPQQSNPVSASVFNTNSAGSAQFEVRVPATVTTLMAAAVTEEPAGGSPQPTSTPFLVGNTE